MVLCEQGVQSNFQPVKIKHVNEASVWHIPHACIVYFILYYLGHAEKKSSGLGH